MIHQTRVIIALIRVKHFTFVPGLNDDNVMELVVQKSNTYRQSLWSRYQRLYGRVSV